MQTQKGRERCSLCDYTSAGTGESKCVGWHGKRLPIPDTHDLDSSHTAHTLPFPQAGQPSQLPMREMGLISGCTWYPRTGYLKH